MDIASKAVERPMVNDGDLPGSFTHTLSVPLSPNMAAERAVVTLEELETAGFSVWIERLPATVDVAARGGFAEREHRRGLSGSRGRAVLLLAGDGDGVVTVSAHRHRFSLAMLRAIARSVAGRDGFSRSQLDISLTTEPHTEDWEPQLCSWGMGQGSHKRSRTEIAHTLPIDADGVGLLVAAFGIILARYGHATVTVPALCSHADGRSEFGLFFNRIGPDADVTAFVAAAKTLRPARYLGDAETGIGILISEVLDGEIYTACDPAPFSLALNVFRHDDGGVEAFLDFDTAVLSTVIARDLAAQLADVASRLANGKICGPAHTASVLSAQRTAELLTLGNNARASAKPATIAELFDLAVAGNRDGIALHYDDQSLTYGELHSRSTHVAGALQSLGVGVGARVGLCLPRGIELVVSMLALARLGAAYVPMDPKYPEERLRYTVEDSAPTLVIAEESEFPEMEGVLRVAPRQLMEMSAPDAPLVAPAPDSIAYIIYTSGSTGRPKGVAIPHRNIAALIGATQDRMNLDSSDVWTLFHSAAFDFSVWEIWGCLLTGGTLVIVPYWISRDPEEFHALLAERQVTVLNQTPSAFYALQQADTARPPLDRLRLVIFGGEALNPRALLPWFRRYSSASCRMINMFGITETTVHVTFQEITPKLALANSRLVGSALAGWAISVRNVEGEVQPLGVAGEIYVGGAALAHEYLNRPELTRERFVDDPVSGTRQYRSGDLGRMHPNGSLDHLGRIDSQVKIRGFRIELDEIRSVIQSVDGVSAAAVIVAEGVEGEASTARLDAFVTLEPRMTSERLRLEIAQYLPDYMMPSRIIPVERIVLTVNGKLDAQAMRELARDSLVPCQQVDAAEPSDGLDAVSEMLAIWQSCLNCAIEPDDDFFQIGGNSILAVKLTAEIRKVVGKPLTLRDLYINQTPRMLSEHIAAQPVAG